MLQLADIIVFCLSFSLPKYVLILQLIQHRLQFKKRDNVQGFLVSQWAKVHTCDVVVLDPTHDLCYLSNPLSLMSFHVATFGQMAK